MIHLDLFFYEFPFFRPQYKRLEGVASHRMAARGRNGKISSRYRIAIIGERREAQASSTNIWYVFTGRDTRCSRKLYRTFLCSVSFGCDTSESEGLPHTH